MGLQVIPSPIPNNVITENHQPGKLTEWNLVSSVFIEILLFRHDWFLADTTGLRLSHLISISYDMQSKCPP